MIFNNLTSDIPFIPWIRSERENRLLLWFVIAAIFIQFLLFKVYYPFPNFMPPDSYSYLKAAYNNQLINIWPIGYSKFLRLFSCFSSSSASLVWFQYLLLEGALVYLLFSIKYLITPGKWMFRVLLAASILNPLIPQISNFVSSDSLFSSLSLIWLTQILWLIRKPTNRLLLAHAIVLVLAFTIRYSALFYPIISILIILLSRSTTGLKIKGIGTIVLFLASFIVITRSAYYKETGTSQFSAFGGWQLAANALYGYAYARQDATADVPARFQLLHNLVNHHMDSISHIPGFMRPDRDVAIYYLWDAKSPLKVYLEQLWTKDTVSPYLKRWASMAPLYAEYGRFLIIRHPAPFLRHYIWPNLIKYYVPPVGFMGYYIMGDSLVEPIAMTWFKWKNNKPYNLFKDKKIEVVTFYPKALALANLLFLLSFVGFFLMNGFSRCSTGVKSILAYVGLIWLLNMVFSVFAAPIELRYQIFPMIIAYIFATLLLSWLIEMSKVTNHADFRGQTALNT